MDEDAANGKCSLVLNASVYDGQGDLVSNLGADFARSVYADFQRLNEYREQVQLRSVQFETRYQGSAAATFQVYTYRRHNQVKIHSRFKSINRDFTIINEIGDIF